MLIWHWNTFFSAFPLWILLNFLFSFLFRVSFVFRLQKILICHFLKFPVSKILILKKLFWRWLERFASRENTGWVEFCFNVSGIYYVGFIKSKWRIGNPFYSINQLSSKNFMIIRNRKGFEQFHIEIL